MSVSFWYRVKERQLSDIEYDRACYHMQRHGNTHMARVLLPVDNQECSQAAILSVLARRWPPDTVFRLCKVVEELHLIPSIQALGMDHVEILKDEQESYGYESRLWLNQLTDKFQSVFPDSDSCIRSGQVVEKLVEEVYNWSADYIVLGSQDLGLTIRCALGSVTASLLKQAPCSVEAVRSRTLRKHLHENGQLTEKEIEELVVSPPKRIVLATDLSQGADAAIDWLVSMHWPADAQFRVATVTTPMHKEQHANWFQVGSAYTREKFHVQQIEKLLKEHAHKVAQTFGTDRVEADVITDESAAEGIYALTENWEADLVVAGCRGLNRNPDFRTGTTAVSILERIHCSMIAIQPMGENQIKFDWHSN